MNGLSERKRQIVYYLTIVLVAIVTLFINIYIHEPYKTYIGIVFEIVAFLSVIRTIDTEQKDTKSVAILLTLILIGQSFDFFKMTIYNIDSVLKGEKNSFDVSKLIELLVTGYLFYLARKKQKGVTAGKNQSARTDSYTQ